MAIKGKTVRFRIVLSLLVLSQVFLPAVALSESEEELRQDLILGSEERFRVTPFAGAVFYGSLDPQPNTGFYGKLSRPSSVLIGLRATAFLTSRLAAELSISRSSTENVHELLYDDLDPPEGDPIFKTQTLQNSIDPILRLGANLLYRPPVKGAIIPHLTAGLGWIHHSPRKGVAVTVEYLDATQPQHPIVTDTIGLPVSYNKLKNQGWLTVDIGSGIIGKVNEDLRMRVDAVLHMSRFSPLNVEGFLSGDVFNAKPQWVRDLEVSMSLIFSVPTEVVGGPKFGINANGLFGSDVENSDSRTAFTEGIFVNYSVNEIVSIQPEFLFSNRYAEADGLSRTSIDTTANEVDSLTYSFKMNLSLLEIPLLTKITLPLGGRVKPQLFVGPSMAMVIGGDYNVEYRRERRGLVEDGGFRFHRSTDFGLVFGVGVEFDAGRGKLNMDVRYKHGLSRVDNTPAEFVSRVDGIPLQSGGPFDIKNRMVSFHLGYSM
jgi:hypothetical protein